MTSVEVETHYITANVSLIVGLVLFPTYNSKNILGRIMVVVLKMKGNTNVKFYYIRFKCMSLTFPLAVA